MRCSKLIVINCISVITLCSSCSSVFRGPTSKPTTAILGAFNKEVMMLEKQLTDKQQQRIEGMRFVTGRLHGKSVVVAWTGIGKVNAAMTTTLLIEHFRPSEVIFSGIAGGVNPQLQPGDIVIAAETAHHDMGILQEDGFYNRGVINPLDGHRNPVYLPADERLLKLAEKAAEQVELETIKTTVGVRSPKIIKGIIVTGDVFVASPAKCAELREKLNADAVEMEGAAVAQICYQRQIPHLVVRSISDKADETAREDSMMFQEMAAKNSSTLITKIAELLASELPVEKTVKSR
ncbi:MAG TPA: 5'-methylthioadenosine/adenosylhomocysteine nucleosidase [Sedimentisphaerales bacterium]|nr:5'-methylthioadenosine/adenosylhomocysteine nucleosidase [Sedimentisphaerales bacterium]